MPQTSRLVKNVSFNLFSNDCVFNRISPVIVLFALVMKKYHCLFIRTFILIGCGMSGITESTYMVMFMKTDSPVFREVPREKAFFKPFSCAVAFT